MVLQRIFAQGGAHPAGGGRSGCGDWRAASIPTLPHGRCKYSPFSYQLRRTDLPDWFLGGRRYSRLRAD